MRVVLGWSGGMASVLALVRLREAGHDVTLLHLTDAAGRRDPASGVPDLLVEEQAACLGLPLALRACGPGAEDATFQDALRGLRPGALASAEGGRSRTWGEKMAGANGIEVLRPLTGLSGAQVLEEALARGFRAFLVACRPPLGPHHLGRFLEPPLLETLAALDARPGDDGSHALVVDGPGFARRVDAAAGEPQPWRGGWRLDLGLRGC